MLGWTKINLRPFSPPFDGQMGLRDSEVKWKQAQQFVLNLGF